MEDGVARLPTAPASRPGIPLAVTEQNRALPDENCRNPDKECVSSFRHERSVSLSFLRYRALQRPCVMCERVGCFIIFQEISKEGGLPMSGTASTFPQWVAPDQKKTHSCRIVSPSPFGAPCPHTRIRLPCPKRTSRTSRPSTARYPSFASTPLSPPHRSIGKGAKAIFPGCSFSVQDPSDISPLPMTCPYPAGIDREARQGLLRWEFPVGRVLRSAPGLPLPLPPQAAGR